MEFGISIAKEFWGLGIGRALTEACIECAKEAGYTQLELDVVSDNASAISLYKKIGFVEYGRNPKGFNSRISGYQELVYTQLYKTPKQTRNYSVHDTSANLAPYVLSSKHAYNRIPIFARVRPRHGKTSRRNRFLPLTYPEKHRII